MDEELVNEMMITNRGLSAVLVIADQGPGLHGAVGIAGAEVIQNQNHLKDIEPL